VSILPIRLLARAPAASHSRSALMCP